MCVHLKRGSKAQPLHPRREEVKADAAGDTIFMLNYVGKRKVFHSSETQKTNRNHVCSETLQRAVSGPSRFAPRALAGPAGWLGPNPNMDGWVRTKKKKTRKKTNDTKVQTGSAFVHTSQQHHARISSRGVAGIIIAAFRGANIFFTSLCSLTLWLCARARFCVRTFPLMRS